MDYTNEISYDTLSLGGLNSIGIHSVMSASYSFYIALKSTVPIMCFAWGRHLFFLIM